MESNQLDAVLKIMKETIEKHMINKDDLRQQLMKSENMDIKLAILVKETFFNNSGLYGLYWEQVYSDLVKDPTKYIVLSEKHMVCYLKINKSHQIEIRLKFDPLMSKL